MGEDRRANEERRQGEPDHLELIFDKRRGERRVDYLKVVGTNIWFGFLIFAVIGSYSAAFIFGLAGRDPNPFATPSVLLWTTLLFIEVSRRKQKKIWMGVASGIATSVIFLFAVSVTRAFNATKTPEGFVASQVASVRQALPIGIGEFTSIVAVKVENKTEVVYDYRIDKIRYSQSLLELENVVAVETVEKFDTLALEYGYTDWEELLRDKIMQTGETLRKNYCENKELQRFRDFNIRLTYLAKWGDGSAIGEFTMLASEDC